ncbi:TolC family protein [Methylophilus aquaticus]|uniref:TolC family protein n=1 Tax=Methylophilus aquaticus TaxID=1971610 RepID=A0ABT9JRC0_9PROT|nr:TolC family protein [Methylophilus aquaticus]MDP8567118.1 TolC family protein [Methylophilus aquaticus]
MPRPIQQQQNIENITHATPSQEGFRQFLNNAYPQTSWPITSWDLDHLTLSALYYHPALKVAKSDYAVALAGITSAGLRPQIGLNSHLAQSNRANGDINPWSYGLQVDIPVITANKRQINIEIAQYQADIAKILMAETAWSLRQQLSMDMISLSEQRAMQWSLSRLHMAQANLLSAYQKRLDVGVAGKSEVLPIKLQHDQLSWQLQQLDTQIRQTEQKITHDAGLTDQQPAAIQIASVNLTQLLKMRLENQQQYKDAQTIQHYALTNRMDIQRGLAQYAKAESQLKLEMAKRYPNLSLSPGILYEYGDKIWSLGISSMLNLLNRSSDLWANAEQVRQNEAARFYALQHHVVQLSEQSYLKFHHATKLLITITEEFEQQVKRKQQLENQWRSGLIDKIEYLQAEIQLYSAQQRLVLQQANVLRALQEIENVMQKPLLLSESIHALDARKQEVQAQ